MNDRRVASRGVEPERAALVLVATRASRKNDPDLALDELEGLALAAGAMVVLRVVQDRRAPDSATYLGRGKAETLAAACGELKVDLVIVDDELSPSQTKNLEKVCGRRVIDRTALILDIFARRARTREGKLQVELAQLEYRLPRLVGSSDALSRLGGGIGTRGPGETKLESDRRRIRQRLSRLKDEIGAVAKRRQFLRVRRERKDVPTVALVGYTNAGKTTLFNRLTGSDAVVSDALFVTLDPLVRRMRLPDARQLMLSDTVGFIDRLPHQLVAAFHATLEEVTAADLLLHVVDAAEPDRQRRIDAVESVLTTVGASDVPTIRVFNKIDLLSSDALDELRAVERGAVFVSARSGQDVTAVQAAVVTGLEMDTQRVQLEFDESRQADRQLVADIYRHGRVVGHQAVDGRVSIDAHVPKRMLSRLRRVRVSA